MTYDPSNSSLSPTLPAWLTSWQCHALTLCALVLAIYFTRLSAVPVCGEESRWANAAREMIATGDWIVPRQQGEIFPERPPLGTWAMALVGLARHDVDLVAIRLPSACAILLLTGLIYAYAYAWMSRWASFSAAAMFATCGQVMALGRFGESESLFTLFVGGSLLTWHLGYIRGWPQAFVWSLGYALAALGALTKGPQAPVYFVAVTSIFLLLRRDWRWLFGWTHLAGLACFTTIVGVWLVPFARLEWSALDDIWAGLAQDRFTTHGLARHLASYPLETLGCLIPWSPLLLSLARPSVWNAVRTNRPQMQFLIVALAVTYPTVWLAAGARGRYYMPLYPCLAVLMGLVLEHLTAWTARRLDRYSWRFYLACLAVAAVGGGAALVVVNLLPGEPLAAARQSTLFLLSWTLAAVTAATLLTWSACGEQAPRPQVAVLVVAAFAGVTYTGAILNTRVNGANDLTAPLAQTKDKLPDPRELVSLGRVYHRFAYSYNTPIRQVPWPRAADDLPPGVTYFCFDRRPGDTEAERAGADGRRGSNTPGTLPFAWDEVAAISCDPVKRNEAHRTVIIGRVRRTEQVAEPPLSRPVRR